MMKLNSFVAACLVAVAPTLASAGTDKFAKVSVTADISAIQNEKAAAYWSNVASDLENALLTRLVDRIGEEGATLSVDLREVELASSFERALNLSDAVLVGQVNVTDLNDNTNFDAYELSVSLGTSQVVSADGQMLTYDSLDTPEAYLALINTFADNVVKKLD